MEKKLFTKYPLDIIVTIQFIIQDSLSFSRGIFWMRRRIAAVWSGLAAGITGRKILLILIGAMVCSFGIHNIHQRTGITEGGIIGLMLLILPRTEDPLPAKGSTLTS